LTKNRFTVINRLLLGFVSCGFVGFIPLVPGTICSAVGCLFLYFFPGSFGHPLAVVFFVAAAVFSVQRLGLSEGEDPRYVVIDELAGILVTMAGHAATPRNLLMGFILFRAFDILKPYPIKKIERLPGAWGIVADDVAAGIFSNIILIVIGRIW
jgi:phosphatidylglycerophosphatase A